MHRRQRLRLLREDEMGLGVPSPGPCLPSSSSVAAVAAPATSGPRGPQEEELLTGWRPPFPPRHCAHAALRPSCPRGARRLHGDHYDHQRQEVGEANLTFTLPPLGAHGDPLYLCSAVGQRPAWDTSPMSACLPPAPHLCLCSYCPGGRTKREGPVASCGRLEKQVGTNRGGFEMAL